MKCETEYSVISSGTEKYTKCGYISISKITNGNRYIQDIDHGILNSEVNSHSLKVKSNYKIENIILSRFELIPALLFKRVKIKDNILVCGLGNIGYATVIYLMKHGYKNITVYRRNKKLPERLKDLKVTDKITSDYNSYIDTTGSSIVLKDIFDKCGALSNIVILSTPRDSEYLIDPLIINRKNLLIYGGHEINGYTSKHRNKVLNKLLSENKKESLEGIICYNKYNKEKLNKIREDKKYIYKVFKY